MFAIPRKNWRQTQRGYSTTISGHRQIKLSSIRKRQMNERGKQAEDEIHKRLTNKEKTLTERKWGSFTFVRM